MGRERKFTRSVSVRIPFWVHHYLNRIAEKEGISVAEIVRRFLTVLALPSVTKEVLRKTVFDLKIPLSTIGNMEKIVTNALNVFVEISPAFRLLFDLNEKFKTLRSEVSSEYIELFKFFDEAQKDRDN
jgi:hypothetical protein